MALERPSQIRPSTGPTRTWTAAEGGPAGSPPSPEIAWRGDTPCPPDADRLAILEVVDLVEQKRQAIGAPSRPVEWCVDGAIPAIAAGAPRAAAIITSMLRIASEADCVRTVRIAVSPSGTGVEFAVTWCGDPPPQAAPRHRDGGMLNVRLNLVRQLLDVLQGVIDIEWGDGCPTRLRVWLPCAHA